MARSTEAHDSRRTDTRDRILTVGLRLFAERGYANTSLREIAEELGVTKAALYFHYKTKEDIVSGILRGYVDDLNGLFDAYAAEPPTLEGRATVLRRFAELQARRGSDLAKLIRQNFTEVINLPVGAEIKETHHKLIDVLSGPEPSVAARTRAFAAVAAIQSVALPMEGVEESARREVALGIALEILGGPAAG